MSVLVGTLQPFARFVPSQLSQPGWQVPSQTPELHAAEMLLVEQL